MCDIYMLEPGRNRKNMDFMGFYPGFNGTVVSDTGDIENTLDAHSCLRLGF